MNVLEVEEHFQLFLITQLGKLIRIPVENIRTIGRVTQGNRLIHLEINEQVISIAAVVENEEEEGNKPELQKIDSPDTTISSTSTVESQTTDQQKMPLDPELYTSENDSEDS